MLGLSLGHLIILFVIALLVGPSRVGALGGQLGRSAKKFKDSLDDIKSTTGLDKVDSVRATMREEVNKFKDSVNPLKTDDSDKKSV